MIVRNLPRPPRRPSVFVLQVDKHPILAFEALSTSEARQLAKEDWFRADLLNLRSGGLPVWDGKAYLEIGPAIGEQVEVVRQLLQQEPRIDDLPIVYLIKIDGNK